jgi:hypothetical protein
MELCYRGAVLSYTCSPNVRKQKIKLKRTQSITAQKVETVECIQSPSR